MTAEWVPSDEWLASWVRHFRGLPPGADVRAWVPVLRRELAAELADRRRRKAAAEAEATVAAPRRRRGSGETSPSDVIRDLLSGPEGSTLILVASLMPAMVTGVRQAQAQDRLRLSARHEAAPVLRYIAGKVRGVEPPGVSWGWGADATATQRAAVNGVTVRRAREWAEGLSRGDRERRDTLVEIDAIGRAVVEAVAPLVIWGPEPGPPRGLWPDPPPPDDVPEASEAVRAGAKPAFIAGRRA